MTSFDFVIVGGGTSGLVLANRLTEDPAVTVLVLEAGQNRLTDPKITTPGLATTTYDDPTYDWAFSTVPQTELYGKSVRHGRGKVLGGSTAINVLSLVYPSRVSMDTWAKLGNKGWDWEGILPYLRKFTTYHPPSDETAKALGIDFIDPANHGTSGPIHISFPDHHGGLAGAWAKAFENSGLTMTTDPMTGFYSGGFNTTSTIHPRTRERSHAGSGYYAPVADRANLKVITECTVEKICLDRGDTVTATGVQASHAGTSTVYTAHKEVILCAGAFQSPQILELSGVGNPDILHKHGIEVLVPNKYVGENLQDHAMTGVSYEVIDGYPTIDWIRDPKVVEKATQLYETERKGPLTGSFHQFASITLVDSNHGEILKQLDSELTKPYGPGFPAREAQFALIREMLEDAKEPSAFMGGGPAQSHLEAETQKELFAISDPRNYACFLLALSYPFSRGTVHIQSANVHDLPDVDPRYLSHPFDLELTARYMQWVPKLCSTEPLTDYLKPNGATIPPQLDVSTLDAAKEHCRRNLVTFNHVCGTCAMMPEDLGGVVDDRLRVYGVKNLRVVDASAFPLIPKVNIQSVVYAAAEKAADLIKEDYA